MKLLYLFKLEQAYFHRQLDLHNLNFVLQLQRFNIQ